MPEPIVDLAVWKALCDAAGADFAVGLVDTFAAELPGMLAELRAAQAAGAAERFRRAAHSLKSNAETFGASRLAECARTLERGGLPAGAASVEALAAEAEATLARLDKQAHG